MKNDWDICKKEKKEKIMKKKLISALLCVAMTASLVVGCGSKADDKKESSDGKTTLTFWCHENEPWVKSYKKVAEKFEKENPDYKVVVKDYRTLKVKQRKR